jgi:LacI family transcriptional regulator
MAKLGIITNNSSEVFQRAVINGVKQVAAAQGHEVIVYASADNEQYATHMMPEYKDLSGVLVIANAAANNVLDSLQHSGKPVSLVAHQVESLPVVMSNNVQGTAELVRHLVVSCGRRNLVYIRGLPDQNDGKEREQSFRHELLRYDLHVPESHFLRGDFSSEIATESLRAFLKTGERFDGVIAADYMMGVAAIHTLREAHVDIPGEVSVVGFGDDQAAEIAGLTTVAANITQLGACAARQIITQINGLQIRGVTMLSVQLVIRNSCGYKRIQGEA